MKSTEYTYGGSICIKGILIPKMRGQKQGQVMRDKTKYSRKVKHEGRNEW